MKEIIIDWINQNAEYIRLAAIVLVVLNLLIIGGAGCSGNLLYIFTHLLNLIFANLTFAIPLVYIIKMYKENN